MYSEIGTLSSLCLQKSAIIQQTENGCIESGGTSDTAKAAMYCHGAVWYLSRVGSPDDDVGVERVELGREHGALRGQLILRSVLHRHRPVLHCGLTPQNGLIDR